MIRRILESLEQTGGSEALIGLDDRCEVAWSQSGNEVLRTAGAWQQELRRRGVQAGDRVAIDLPRGPHLLAAHVAVLASGATVVPMNASLPESERKEILEHADVRALVTPGDVPGQRGTVQLTEGRPQAPCLLLFTSGTTGKPKGVPLSRENLEANLAALAEAWGLSREDRLVHVLPCHHVHGLALAFYGSARLGIPIVLLRRFDAACCLEALATQEATVFMGVPTMFRRMTRSRTRRDLPRMRVFISGSAALDPLDFRDFEARFGHRPVERYGLSETMIVSTNPLEGERRPGTVGLPLPDTEVRFAEDGEIEVRGPAVMAAYWRSPELTREALHGGFFRTGDLGHLDDAGYLRITGRKKELIIVGGSNVLPGEVEQGLAGDPGVEELAIAGHPDPDLGEIVAAFVVPRAGQEPEEIESRLRALAAERLAPYKRPRIYRFLAVLPRNVMGKIDRGGLKG
jgi:malonyl-CoA/methylmalonyl-CoA synthetase